MLEVGLSFLWHQHQPYYPDDVGGANPMPWVRLHAAKDYWGMAAHLEEVPEMRVTINLVPSLIVQLLAYTEKGAEDKHLHVSRIPADGLARDDAVYMLDNFFMAHADQMIRPYKRYQELYLNRGFGVDDAAKALRRFSVRDLRDLQVWSNLTWMHPLAVARDAELREFQAKGRHYTEEDKTWLLSKQLQLLGEVIPMHRKLRERGQVELTTTPFYHPILPLLYDKRLAREAMPQVPLPRYLVSYAEDAVLHVRRAVEFHERVFGEKPRGMWPAEGSVCQQMIPDLASAGIEWIASDEEILRQSTQGQVHRDAEGHVNHPERLYRPYRLAEGSSEMNIVFRDHALSDLIGFHYYRSPAVKAADDFVGKVQAIAKAAKQRDGSRPAMVSVILDGENCWEYYPGGGVEFLRTLYQRLTQTPGVGTFKVGEFLAQYPPGSGDRLERLAAGSWIHHNFAIWIGHEEDNRAWDALHLTREYLRAATAEGRVPRETLDRAWEELYIAEGSDWFWWFGEDHSSPQDALFDYLFRKHLQNVYWILGAQPPAELERVISRAGRRPAHTQPRGFVDVTVDGKRTFFEWVNAGRYVCHSERGTMAMVTKGPLKEIYFGFDVESLLLRVDVEGQARLKLEPVETLRVAFVEPEGYELVIAHPGWQEPIAQLYHHDHVVPEAGIRVACDSIVEISVPFEKLGLVADAAIHFFVELESGEQSLDRAPREGTIELLAPSPDFEQIMWQA